MFYLVITYIKLPLPTSGAMNTELRDRSPLHMLPYPTHAHPRMSAHMHSISQPNPNDLNFWKYHEIQGLISFLANVCACNRVWHTAITKIKA